MDTPTYWEETSNHHLKFESGASSSTEGSSLACKEEQSIFHYCDGNLNFATVANSEDDEYGYHKKKVSRDPMSHRIIEKRRRDRMNNCLADLSRLIPAEYLKKGRGRIEKTEIIEMAIRHMKHLQTHACRHGDQCNGNSVSSNGDLSQQPPIAEEAPDQPPGNGAGGGGGGGGGGNGGGTGGPIVLEHYRLGYQECLSEAMHFLVEVEGFFAGDPLCVQLINHLQRHCDRILKGDRLNYPRTHLGDTTSSSGSSCGSGRGRSSVVGGGGGGGGGGGSSGGLCSSGLGSASASGSSPGSCSDGGGRAEPPPQSPREVGPGRRTTGAASLASLAALGRHDELAARGCYDELPPSTQPLTAQAPPLGSQLRDMLTGAPAPQDRQCLGGEVLMCAVGPGVHPRPMGGGVHVPSGTSVIHGAVPPPARPHPHPHPHPHPLKHHPQYPPPLSQPYSSASPGLTADSVPASLYKFKNNIKQRFSAEHLNGVVDSPGRHSYPKRRRFICEQDDSSNGANGLLSLSVRRRDSETCSVPSPPGSPLPLAPGAYTTAPPATAARSPLPPSPATTPPPAKFSLIGSGPPPPPHAAAPPRPVPIFALHARGAYYVPLTLDSDVLAPFVECLCEGQSAAETGHASMALHPVTISVNFTRSPTSCPRLTSTRHLGACGASAAPWKMEPGVFGNPRWPECSPDRG